MLYVISRSTGQGIKAGIVSSLGIACGCLVHLTAAVAGLSAVIAGSAIAFGVIKFTGALYLVYLGVKSFTEKGPDILGGKKFSETTYPKIFWQGVLTNVLNPKVALFFLAFLPQFVKMDSAHPQWQILFLGTWFDFSGTVVNVLVALLFGRLGSWLARSAWFLKIQQKMTGLMLILLGIRIAFTTKR
jgi:threonine/homoserine/homoserine lactone efflux protein